MSHSDEGPGPQLSVELLKSIWTTQQASDSEVSSHGDDIPANFDGGKRKRQDTESSQELPSSLSGSDDRAVIPFETFKLKRLQRAKRVASEAVSDSRGRKDIYLIPNTPKAPQRFTRNSRQNALPKVGSNDDSDNELSEQDNLRGKNGYYRARPNFTLQVSSDEQVSAGGESYDAWSEKESEDETEDEEKWDEDDESLRAHEKHAENKEREQPKYAESTSNPSTLRRSSRLMAKAASLPRSSRLSGPRRPKHAFTSPISPGRRILTRLAKQKLKGVEVPASSPISPLRRARYSESEIGNSRDASPTDKDSGDGNSQQAENRTIISSPKKPENVAEEEADLGSQNENQTSTNNSSDHRIQIRPGSEPNLELQSEHESKHGSVIDASEFENGSQFEDESREIDFQNTPHQDSDPANFWPAATLFGQHTNWSELLAETKKLIPGLPITQKNPLLRKLLTAIIQTKELYAETREIRLDYQKVPDHLYEAEKYSSQKVAEHVSLILSRVRLVFDENGDLVTNSRGLERKRQVVHEIISFGVPELVDVLKSCITAHYVDHELSVDGIKQLTQLLQSLSLLCEKIQPKFFRPYINFGDALQRIRVVSRFLWAVFDNESSELQAKRRLARFHNIQQQRRTRPNRDTPNRKRHRQEITSTTSNEEPREHISVLSIDEEWSNEELSESLDEPPWTTAESEALVTGLERYQGLNRFTMILRDFKAELRGRTMEDLRLKAREIRDSYVAAMKLDSHMLDPRRWGWLLEI
ncbi:hypothetical protein I7I48_10796 [Histoplasma ohiense]|nr:hypothetical protein I7I48_10796 [Histoplasma ohiense (nom. inval.)]